MLVTWATSHGSNVVGPGIVTQAEVMADFSISITNPVTEAVPMQANGSVLRIKTSGTAAAAAVDLTKITLTVSDLGHDTSGNQASRTRTINLRSLFFGPYNEMTAYQPVLGEFYFKMDDFIFNQDPTWKTTVTSINFAANWIAGQPVGLVLTASVTRSDSLSYFNFPIKSPTAPYQLVSSGGTLPFELTMLHSYPSALVGVGGSPSMVACIEAWAVDSGATAGTVVRGSSFVRSPLTPNNATTVGLPVPTYAVNVDPAGLLPGRCGVRWTVKPWIGPPVQSTVYGTAYPTVNVATEIPFGYDTDGSHAPIYALLNYDPAATNSPNWSANIASSVNVATCPTTGLCRTLAGALAAGVYYADIGTLMTAVRRYNKGATGPFTILNDNGVGTQSVAGRTTSHDDLSGAVAVCPPTPSSVLGADLGCYSVRISTSNQTNFPPGITMAEIRSDTGLPQTAVRWRGTNSAGGATAVKTHMSRLRLRGLTLDGTGQATASDNIIFDGTAAAGAPTVTTTEIASCYVHRVDCVIRETTSVAAGTSVCHRQYGWLVDQRVADYNFASGIAVTLGSTTFAGLMASIGSAYLVDATRAIVAVADPMCLLGVKLQNAPVSPPGQNRTSIGVKPWYGSLAFNVDAYIALTSDNSGVPWDDGGGNMPVTGGLGRANLLCRMDTTAGTQSGYKAIGDNARVVVDSYIMWHVTVAAKNAVGIGTGRMNLGYLEQGWQRINKRLTGGYPACQSYNCKGDSMVAPETPTSSGDGAWGSTTAYTIGAIVTNGGHGFECIQDVAANSGILLTNTAFWFDGGLSSVAYNQQPLRQGNSDFRYHVGFRGTAASNTANGDTSTGTSSWYGIAWGPLEKLQQTWANYFNNMAADDYSPKVGGVLVNMVPVGGAVLPFDLLGNPFRNDGTDATGALQVP